MKKKILIVIADYYKDIAKNLTSSAVEILKHNKLSYEIIPVPGVYEIPQMIKWQIKDKGMNCFLALGCVIKGDTYHFEVISDSVGKALLDLVKDNKRTLIANGIINSYNMTQAKKRSQMNSSKNKGFEAASAMVKMIQCLI